MIDCILMKMHDNLRLNDEMIYKKIICLCLVLPFASHPTKNHSDKFTKIYSYKINVLFLYKKIKFHSSINQLLFFQNSACKILSVQTNIHSNLHL